MGGGEGWRSGSERGGVTAVVCRARQIRAQIEELEAEIVKGDGQEEEKANK